MGALMESNKQAAAAGAVLLVLFCAFFWLGFYVGKSAARQTPAAAATETPAEQPAPPAERTGYRIASN
jgi:hypothetical protein